MLSQFDKEIVQSYYRLSIIVSSIIAFLIVATFYTIFNFRVEYAIGLAFLSLSIGISQTSKGKYSHLPFLLSLLGGASFILGGPFGWVLGGCSIGGNIIYEYAGKHQIYKNKAETLLSFERYRVLRLITILHSYGYDVNLGEFPKFCDKKYVEATFSKKNRGNTKPLLTKNLHKQDHDIRISWINGSFSIMIKETTGKDQIRSYDDTKLEEEFEKIKAEINQYKKEAEKITQIGKVHQTIYEEMEIIEEAIEKPDEVIQNKQKMEKLKNIFSSILEIAQPK